MSRGLELVWRTLFGYSVPTIGVAKVENNAMTNSGDPNSRQHSSDKEFCWQVGETLFLPNKLPRLMGIVNATPDSFSDGGLYIDAGAAIEQALQLADAGADFLDVGGESTRPGAAIVSEEEELRRVIPVIAGLAKQTSLPISIDTSKATVARRALEVGARIVNDISGLTFDSEMPSVCAESDCGVVCMHIQGTPRTMQDEPRYDDVVEDICRFLASRLESLAEAGIAPERVMLDPGIGFGKTAEHNLQILANIDRLHSLGRPVLIGHSRKRFLGKLLGKPLDERLFGTVGVAIALAEQSVDVIRVHDIAAVHDCLIAWKAVVDRGSP